MPSLDSAPPVEVARAASNATLMISASSICTDGENARACRFFRIVATMHGGVDVFNASSTRSRVNGPDPNGSSVTPIARASRSMTAAFI